MQSNPGADTSNASGQQPRAERVLVLFAATVLFAVFVGGFARLGAFVGFDEPVVEPPPTLPSTPFNESGVSSVTGSVLPASPSSLAADPVVPTTLPSTPGTSQPGVTSLVPNTEPSALPPRWPVSLPDPGEHRLLAVESDQEDRWLLAVPGNVALAGGRFVAALKDLDWSVDAVVTPRTLTAVGTREQERVSVTLRPGDGGLPAGWLLLDVVYQPTVPDFETPPSSSVPPEDEVTKRS